MSRFVKMLVGLLLALNIQLPIVTPVSAQQFSCSVRKYCKQMRSCTEAVYHLRQCGDTARDGDDDGIPCESICGKTKPAMNQKLNQGR